MKECGIERVFNRYVTVIGSRRTPQAALDQAVSIMRKWIQDDYIFRSGNARGMDQLVSTMIEEPYREIYLPYEGFGPNGKLLIDSWIPCEDWDTYKEAERIVHDLHPLHHGLKKYQMPYLIRDVYEVLGYSLREPSETVLCWTPDGAETQDQCSRMTGGTGMAIRVAYEYGIEVINLQKRMREAL